MYWEMAALLTYRLSSATPLNTWSRAHFRPFRLGAITTKRSKTDTRLPTEHSSNFPSEDIQTQVSTLRDLFSTIAHLYKPLSSSPMPQT